MAGTAVLTRRSGSHASNAASKNETDNANVTDNATDEPTAPVTEEQDVPTNVVNGMDDPDLLAGLVFDLPAPAASGFGKGRQAKPADERTTKVLDAMAARNGGWMVFKGTNETVRTTLRHAASAWEKSHKTANLRLKVTNITPDMLNANTPAATVIRETHGVTESDLGKISPDADKKNDRVSVIYQLVAKSE